MMLWGKVFGAWCRARRGIFAYVGLLYGFIFAVYALYGHPWWVGGYAALLGLAAGLVFAAVDFARFAARHAALARLAGHFPTGSLPPAANLPEADYAGIVAALEAERARLEAENEHRRRDAEEYYTLWAHQVKTPLAAMGLLLQSGGASRADLEQELFRIGQYVDMVLQYQRLSSMEGDLLLQRHNLAALAKKAAKNCAPLFIHRGLSVSVEGVSGSLITDEKWFGFVLEQLFANAAKYTRHGGVRVYGEGACLVVEDSGAGIPPEDLPRVFERGFTGAAGRSERSSTGIGLYLCREILGRLGFSISIESRLGQGTRVRLHLAQETLEVD